MNPFETRTASPEENAAFQQAEGFTKQRTEKNDSAGSAAVDLNKGGKGNATHTPHEPLPELPDVMPFDYLYLPDALRGYVRDISERMQCPPDFAAVGVLVMAATIVGRKVAIRPKRKDDWTVIPNLWELYT